MEPDDTEHLRAMLAQIRAVRLSTRDLSRRVEEIILEARRGHGS